MTTDATVHKVVRAHPPDGCYMVNCSKDGANESRIYYYLKIQFGKEFNSSDRHNGVVRMTTTPPNEFIPWDEGILTSIEFADHVTFFWNMPPGSVDKPALTQVGTASNSAGANWNLYRDDGRVLFVDPVDGFEARSIYFCC